ncbi:MAG: alanine--tRNA ligase-related protein [Patescibacteria group bacterium]
MNEYACDAQIIEVITEDRKTVVILNQTIFYPQGGGQPYDTGIISSGNKKFVVEEVRFVDGIVKHIGKFESEALKIGEMVTCSIDIERRQLHTRLHSGGHLVDMGLKQLGISWRPGKGYHFPNGPYVEYAGSLENVDVEKLKVDLETACSQIVQKGTETRVLFMPKEEMTSVCAFVPDYIPADKPARVVMYGDFGIPCGGTHVSNLSKIGRMTIRKIKQDGENIRVSYSID